MAPKKKQPVGPAKVKKTRKSQATVLAEATQVIKLISEDMSARQACSIVGLNVSYFFQYLTRHADLYTQYAKAIEIRADITFDGIANLEEQCLSGLLDPKAFRAVADIRRWRLGQMKAKYRDKPEQAIDVNLSGKIEVSWTNGDNNG